ncbi:transport and Golgi organization protein 11 [Contarinia nasturtii]|uniref:transport and Golgi organization protein 11 n=1 Tax=Contarinia nasturtii TaxID=265458 RepID=UPI0012D38EAA|nr:transport and Golgi organization protein 11 [Contarinia nasturtii]
MAVPGSPSSFINGYEEDPIFQKSHYTQDISEQMRVPKRIRATGEFSDDFDIPMGNGTSHWAYHDKIDMTVPDRIMVIGQEQHLGTRTAPREIMLDNTILQPHDDHPVRVSTPPRVITLSEHRFPTVADDQYTPDAEQVNGHENEYSSLGSNDDRHLAVSKPKKLFSNDFFNTSREATPPYGEHATPSEEVTHLRRQVSRLNRRVLSIEIENLQRQQREKVVYLLGLAYFCFKAIMWLNRN